MVAGGGTSGQVARSSTDQNAKAFVAEQEHRSGQRPPRRRWETLAARGLLVAAVVVAVIWGAVEAV